MAGESRRWSPGDRVVWPHRERYGKTYMTVQSSGTVTAVDEPGLPRGVRVQFDSPVHGVSDCYATYDELLSEQRAEGGAR